MVEENLISEDPATVPAQGECDPRRSLEGQVQLGRKQPASIMIHSNTHTSFVIKKTITLTVKCCLYHVTTGGQKPDSFFKL